MNSSYFMEPEHLEPDEIEYELNIRGMPPQITRLRARNLRERLLMEMRKETLAPMECLNKDVAVEISIVHGKLKQLDYGLVNAADSNCFKSMEVLLSRLYHLSSRLNRVKSDDHRIIKQQEILSKKMSSYIEIVLLSLEGKVELKNQLKSLNIASLSSSTIDEARALTPIPLPSMPRPMSILERGKALLPIPEDNFDKHVPSILKPSTHYGTPPPRSNAGEDLSAYLDELDLSECESDLEISAILRKDNPKKKTGTVPKKTGAPIPNFQDYRSSGFTSRLIPQEVDLNEAFFPRKKPVDGWKNNLNVNTTTPLDLTARIPSVYKRGTRSVPLPARNPRNPLPVIDDVEDRQRFRNRNPILNWQLVFTGVQGKGLSISDFLTQVHLMARADSVSERELFVSAIHLFTGSARNWYVAFEKYYDNWQQLVHALNEQFLPHDSDLSRLREAESRKQRTDEAFVLFLSEMMNLFDHLQVPLPENRKLSIVMRNMLPYLRQALALTEVDDLHTLVRLCRKLESIRSTTVSQKNVSEIRANSPQPFNSSSDKFCHNCQETGHLHPDCKYPKIRVFCYRCGELGQLATTCTVCRQGSGNQLTRPSYSNRFARDGQ